MSLEYSKYLCVNAPAHLLFFASNHLFVLDNDSNLHRFDTRTPNPKRTDPMPFSYQVPFRHYRGHAASPDGKKLLLFDHSQQKRRVFDLHLHEEEPSLKQGQWLEWNETAPEVAAFSHDGRYLAAGGPDGKVALYDTHTSRFFGYLPRSNEYISAITFSPDTNQVAYASFNRQLTVFDLTQHLTVVRHSTGEVVTCTRFLHRPGMLVYGNRAGQIMLLDTITGRIIGCLGRTVDWPIELWVDPEDRYILVSDRSGYIYVMSPWDKEKSEPPLCKFSGAAVSIQKRDNRFFFLVEDGNVMMHPLDRSLNDLHEARASGDIEKVAGAIRSNPLLKFEATDIIAEVKSAYTRRMDQAIRHIAKGNVTEARRQIGPFLYDQSHNQQFTRFAKEAQSIEQLHTFLRTGQFGAAYALIEKVPLLKETPFFITLEQRFNDAFVNAITKLKAGDPVNAKKALRLFRAAPGKADLIQSLFTNPLPFAQALAMVRQDMAKTLEKLLVKYPDVANAPFVILYQTQLLQDAEKLEALMEAGLYEPAAVLAEKLRDRGGRFVEQYQDTLTHLEHYSTFKTLVTNKRYSEAMAMIQEHPGLTVTDSYHQLNLLIANRYDHATKLALQQRFKEMNTLLKPLLAFDFSRHRAMHIYKLYYITQIRTIGHTFSQGHWRRAIGNFVRRFGYGDEIEFLAKRYNQDQILTEYRNCTADLGHQFGFAEKIHAILKITASYPTCTMPKASP